MQLMADARPSSTARMPGLGWIDGEVRRLDAGRAGAQGPAHGLERAGAARRAHPLLRRHRNGAHAYFVHSYQLRAARPRATSLATTEYGGDDARADRRPRQHRRHAVPSGEEPGRRPAPDRATSAWRCGWRPDDPLSRHRPEGRRVRAAGARRHERGDGVQRRSGRPGAALRRRRLRMAACRRPRRRLRRASR